MTGEGEGDGGAEAVAGVDFGVVVLDGALAGFGEGVTGVFDGYFDMGFFLVGADGDGVVFVGAGEGGFEVFLESLL